MTNRRRGRLVALEGIDGAGKSTLARALGSALRRRGYSVALRREPADRRLGQLAQEASGRDPWTGAVYFTVDRFLARPALRAALATHDFVISDRSFFSTLAYQGSAVSPTARRRLEQMQVGATIAPDRVVLLTVPPTTALARVGGRSSRRSPLERRRTLERVAREYGRLARRPGWTVLDGRGDPRTLVGAALRAVGPRRRPVRSRRARGRR